jgi:hypothetical protein
MNDEKLKFLRAVFPDHQISLKPIPLKRDSAKGQCQECGSYHGLPAVHLKYVGHAALTDRLLDTDLNWNWEPLALTTEGLPLFDQSGGLWIKLTVCGTTRLGYGNAVSSDYKEIGSREKEVIGDALRNAGMRFGMALDLWHKGDLHGAEEESKSLPKIPDKPPAHPQEPYEEDVDFDNLPKEPPKPAPFPKDTKASQKSSAKVTMPQINRLMAIANSYGWSDAMIKAELKEAFNLESKKDLTRAQYDKLIGTIEMSRN